MQVVAYGLAILGILIIWEAIKGLRDTGAAQSAANAAAGQAGSTGGSAAPIYPSVSPSSDIQAVAKAHSMLTGIPESVYLAVAANESNLTGYCWPPGSNNCGYFGQSGEGPAGSHSFSGGAGQTPELALYPSLDQAFSGWDAFLQHTYPSCWGSRNNPVEFIPCLVAHNYSGGDQSWTGTILGRIAGYHAQGIP